MNIQLLLCGLFFIQIIRNHITELIASHLFIEAHAVHSHHRSLRSKKLAAALDVSPLALNVPDIDSHFGIMHTLFALEDRYGLIIEIRDGEMLFRIDPRRSKEAADLSEQASAWAVVSEKYRAGEITKDEYDKWRYYYPEFDDSQITAKVPSQELSDALVKAMKKNLKD